MRDVIVSENYRGYQIEVYPEDDPLDPRKENDNLGTMICFHKRYKLGDAHGYSSVQSFIQDVTKKEDDELSSSPNEDLDTGANYRMVWLPIYMYDHSGITLRTTPFSDPWDSGQVGVIFATYDDIMIDRLITHTGDDDWVPSAEVIESCEAVLRGEVAEYDAYVSGSQCYFSIFENLGTDEDENDFHEDAIDGCSGFTDSEEALQTAREAVDALIEQKR